MKRKQSIGEVIQALRLARNISQSKLSSLSSIDRTYISLIERDLRNPTVKVVSKIGDALGLKASEIIRQTE